MSTAKEIFDKAMSLSVSERASLAHQLILSLDDSSDYELDPAYEEKIKQRVEEVRDGTAQGRPAGEVLENIKGKYK
jgi:putative addiction module component (TIGR02574 family)